MKITIGRDRTCSIQVDERFDTVSHNHAEIERTTDGRLLFIDHSTNGSTVNGQKIHNGSTYVNEGERIMLANAYDVSWNDVLAMLPRPNPSRVTVQHNIHSDPDYQSGRATNRYVPPVMPGANVSQPQPSGLTEEELRRWNWGGFLLSWIWGLGNNVWWALLALIPGISLVVAIMLGLRGTRASWEAGKWSSPAQFWESQRRWTFAGLIVTGVGVLIYLVFFIVAMAS